MIIIALNIALVYLAFTSLVLLRNLFEFESLSKQASYSTDKQPMISICIPARNEVDHIERCITSALKQDYENFEVLVLDDQSTDGTSELVEGLAGIIHNLRYLKGAEKPDDWLGKPWACHQLSIQAKGESLVFIDADVWLEPDALMKSVHQLRTYDAITVWPQQHFGNFWERQVVPLIYFALFTLLPAVYVQRAPRWLPSFLRTKMAPLFAAACGQYIAFTKTCYSRIGGHEAVKQAVVEDVELAKRIKGHGLTLRMLHGVDTVHCRMYQSHSEIWNGLRKNFFLGFNQNTFFFIVMASLHLLVFLFPIYALISGLIAGAGLQILLSSIALIVVLIQRILLNSLFRWSLLSSMLHPLSVLWYQALGIQCLIDYYTNRKALWKGREV